MEKNKLGRFRTLFASPVFSEVGFTGGIVRPVTRSKELMANYEQPSIKGADCWYTEIECRKKTAADSREAWESWNNIFISILHQHRELLSQTEVLFTEIKKIASEIPRSYSIWSKLDKIEYELFDDEDLALCQVNLKSFISMIRFLPVIEERCKDLSFYFNEGSKSFGFTISKSTHSKQRLDLRFKENGEILFSFVDGIEGFSRISGSSYLTDYLSNSSKIKKIINLLDY